MTNPKNLDENDDQKDLKKHGVQNIIPSGDEYYTLDLRRGDNSNEEVLPDNDIEGSSPLDETSTNDVNTSPLPQGVPSASNSHNSKIKKNFVDENNENGVTVGKPGHWGVDEDTD